MPQQQSNQNAILAKLKGKGASKAFDKVKGNEKVLPKGGNFIPPGIEQGVAQLIVCRLDERGEGENKGKPYLNIQAIIVEVKDVAPELQVAVKKRIFNGEDLFDTPKASKTKTQEQHIDVALNKLRLLGLDTDGLNFDDIVESLEALEQEKPYFAFRTWQGNPWKGKPGKVNVTWSDKIEDYTGPDTSDSGVEDNTSADTSSDDSNDTVDWVELAKKADKGNQAAKDQFEAAYEGYSVTKDEFDEVENYAALAEMFTERGNGDSEPWIPAVDEVYKIKLKGAKKAVDVRVTAVSTKKGTVDVIGVADKKAYKALPFNNEGDAKQIDGQDV